MPCAGPAAGEKGGRQAASCGPDAGRRILSQEARMHWGQRVLGEAPERGAGRSPSDPSAAGQAPDAPSHVFISYASHDAAAADAVVEALEGHGIKCWMAPRDVVPGALYADEIVRAINEASVVVLILSEQAVASAHVGKEIERASSKRRRIVALRTESVSLPRAFEYFLSQSQWIDVGSAGIAAAAAKLVEAVRRHLNSSALIEWPGPSGKPLPNSATTVPFRRWLIIGTFAVVLLGLFYFALERLWLPKQLGLLTPRQTHNV